MFGSLLGKIIAAPARVVNIAAKAAIAPAKLAMDEDPWEKNSLDDLADGVERSAKKILD